MYIFFCLLYFFFVYIFLSPATVALTPLARSCVVGSHPLRVFTQFNVIQGRRIDI